MERTVITAVVTALLSGLSPLHAQETLTGKQIVDASYEATKLAGSEAVATMIIRDEKGRERVRNVAQATKLCDNGETEKKLIRFLAPADVKGTGFLTFDYEDRDDDTWLYMPALRKTRRIVSSEKAKSFMGSEFSYADITRLNLDDFSYSPPVAETVSDTPCYKVEIIPLNDDIMDDNGFSKKVVWAGCDDYVIRKALYFDLDGELHKELEVRKIAELDTAGHKFKPTDMVMTNKQTGRQSMFVTEKISFNPDIKDEYFTTRYLERQ